MEGLNALLAVLSTPSCAPVIAASRLRKGSATSARGAGRFVADALVTATAAGATGVRVLRADSAFYCHEVIAAATRGGARFSITARQNAVGPGGDRGHRPRRVDHHQVPQRHLRRGPARWISDAEVAEIGYTAFTSRRKAQHVSARLIVRRVPDLNPANQSELFTVYRYHAVFTNSPAADARRRGRAPRPRDRRAGHRRPQERPARAPTLGSFAANSAWLVCAAIAFNLTRAAGTLASAFHAKATTATIRTHLINVPARLARSARRLTLHLPAPGPGSRPGNKCSPRRHSPPTAA